MTNNCTTPNKTLLSVSSPCSILVATGTVAAFVAQPAASTTIFDTNNYPSNTNL